MKKKLLLLSAIATFAFALCGCDSSDKKSTTEKDLLEDVTIPEVTEEDTAEATEEEDISVQVEDAQRGTVENGVYTNKVFKISFPIQDNWYVCSDAEIAQILGIVVDSLDEDGSMTVEQFEAATAGTTYDLIFYLSDMQSNVNVTFMSLDRVGMYAALPVERYAEISASQLESMTNVNYTVSEVVTETYGGSDYAVVDAETDQGYAQKMLLKKENGYMICITLTYFPELEGEMQSFLDSFTEVN